MKIIIEQKDVGKEFDLDILTKLSNDKKESLFMNLPIGRRMDPLNRILKKIGENSSDNKVSIKKYNKPIKRGRPKGKKQNPLPFSSDINPLTGEPYVKRGVEETMRTDDIVAGSNLIKGK